MSANMEFYHNLNDELKPYIKSIWYSDGKLENSHKPYQLLPMTHLDMVFIQQGSTKLIIDNQVIETSNVVLQGLQTNIVEIIHDAQIEAYGISFTPWGLYPFTNQSIYDIINDSKGYNDIGLTLVKDISQALTEQENQKTFKSIEEVLLNHLHLTATYKAAIPTLKSFTENDVTSIKDFCQEHHVHKRKLERDFKKFIGVTPRDFQRIKQLVLATRQILSDKAKTLTDIGQESNYYDQSHFIRHFKEVLNDTPQTFIKKDQALLSKIKTK